MAKPILNKAQEQNPAEPRDESNVKIEFSKELLTELQNNTFSRRCEEDVIKHIGKDAKEWWINNGYGNISTWEELVKKLFKKFYPLSCASNYDKMSDDDEEEIRKGEELLNEEVSSDDEWEKHKSGNPPNDSFPKPYLNINNEKDKNHYDENNKHADKLSGMDLSGAPQSENINNEQPKEGICRVEKFEVIKYMIRGNEEFLAICTRECDSWARTVNGVSSQGNGRNQNGDAVNDNIRGDVSRGCTYKEFLACNPKEYDGKGGAIVYTRWIEKMESVQDMSGFRDSQKVKYTAGLFVCKPLTWWNSQIHIRGQEAVVGMSWEDFKTLTREEFCPSNEMQKLETELWNYAMVGAGHAACTDRFHELARNQNGNAVNDNIRGDVSRGCTYKEFLACNPKEYDGDKSEGMSWEDFKTLTREEFCPSNEMQKLETELWNHAMVGAGHAACTNRFHKLARLVPHFVTPKGKRIERYAYGLIAFTNFEE
ncbi:hypothetical protein Tco_1133970 [Tanacetum coccineum]